MYLKMYDLFCCYSKKRFVWWYFWFFFQSQNAIVGFSLSALLLAAFGLLVYLFRRFFGEKKDKKKSSSLLPSWQYYSEKLLYIIQFEFGTLQKIKLEICVCNDLFCVKRSLLLSVKTNLVQIIFYLKFCLCQIFKFDIITFFAICYYFVRIVRFFFLLLLCLS